MLDRRDLSLNRRRIVDSVKWYWFKSIGWNPHRGQICCHISQARNRYSTSGRRGGKSEWAAHEASAYAIAGPYRIWLVGQSYDLVYKEWRVIINDLLHPANPHIVVKLNDNKESGHLYCKLSNGAEIEGRSLGQRDRNPLIGDEIDLLILCEGSRISELGGDDGVWETELSGNLNSRLGDMICPTTPSGRDDWLFPRFQAAITGKARDSFAIRWPAWENVYGWLEDIQHLYETLSPRAFAQEVLGLFVSWAGSIWIKDCRFEPKKHVVSLPQIPSWWRRVEVIDPGFSDYLFWLAAVSDTLGNVYVIDEFERKDMLTSEVVKEIRRRRELVPCIHKVPIHIDPEDSRFRGELKPFYDMMPIKANNDVTGGFSQGAILFGANKLFISDKCKRTICCLENHEWDANKVKANGDRVQKRDEYIHGSDAFRYLCMSEFLNIRSVRPPDEEKIFNDDTVLVQDLLDSLTPNYDSRLPLTEEYNYN